MSDFLFVKKFLMGLQLEQFFRQEKFFFLSDTLNKILSVFLEPTEDSGKIAESNVWDTPCAVCCAVPLGLWWFELSIDIPFPPATETSHITT
jgi:hypothetical protein